MVGVLPIKSMNTDSKIYVAGHRGLVGSAIVRVLENEGYTNIIVRTRDELDLLNQQATEDFFTQEQPEFVFLAAARVGGILANRDYPADFAYENLEVQNNVIHAAHRARVRKLMFLGSSCIYPKLAEQPIREDALLTGSLESTNAPYAIAKIAGIVLCQSYRRQYDDNFIAVMPTNLYGPNDNFDLTSSHVLPALIRKFHNAKTAGDSAVTLWGTGTPKREFLHVDDMAAACVHLMKSYDGPEIVNIGTGEDISIRDLAELVQQTVGYQGTIVWDTTKPDGTPRKLLDVSRLHELGFHHQIDLKRGLRDTYQWYRETISSG